MVNSLFFSPVAFLFELLEPFPIAGTITNAHKRAIMIGFKNDSSFEIKN